MGWLMRVPLIGSLPYRVPHPKKPLWVGVLAEFAYQLDTS